MNLYSNKPIELHFQNHNKMQLLPHRAQDLELDNICLMLWDHRAPHVFGGQRRFRRRDDKTPGVKQDLHNAAAGRLVQAGQRGALATAHKAARAGGQ